MEITNLELLHIKQGLFDMAKVPAKGQVKFKILHNLKEVDSEIPALMDSLEVNADGEITMDDEGKMEILETKVDVNLYTFTPSELEPLEISAEILMQIEPLIEIK